MGWLKEHAFALGLVAAGLFLFLFGLVKWTGHRKRRLEADPASE